MNQWSCNKLFGSSPEILPKLSLSVHYYDQSLCDVVCSSSRSGSSHLPVPVGQVVLITSKCALFIFTTKKQTGPAETVLPFVDVLFLE